MNQQIGNDALLGDIHAATTRGETWMAYNTVPTLLKKGDIRFFRTKEEAIEFAIDNYSNDDQYKVLHALPVRDVLHRMEHSNNLLPDLVSAINEHHWKQFKDVDENTLDNKESHAATNALIDHIAEQQLLTSRLKDISMNSENFEHLKDNLKYMGFGDTLHAQLEKELSKGSPQFQLQIETEINGKAFAAMLNFRKSDTTDRYFFNSYHATLQRRDGEIVDQAFYLNKGKGVTAKEAFNLLDGRAVHKELMTKKGEPYTAWLQLEFDKKDKNNNHEVKQIHEAYGFRLKETLAKYHITELKDPAGAEKLMASLKKGNLQAVGLEGAGGVTKAFIEALPQFKTLTFYDSHLMRMGPEEGKKYLKQGDDPTSVKESAQQKKSVDKAKGEAVKEVKEKRPRPKAKNQSKRS